MDKPVTKAELDQFYGTEVSPAEVKAAIERHAKAFDADDLAIIVGEIQSNILVMLELGFCDAIGNALMRERRKLIANCVSIELFGRHGCVKADEVDL